MNFDSKMMGQYLLRAHDRHYIREGKEGLKRLVESNRVGPQIGGSSVELGGKKKTKQKNRWNRRNKKILFGKTAEEGNDSGRKQGQEGNVCKIV